MKNILAGNLLRFGVRNLSESELKHIQQLTEQVPPGHLVPAGHLGGLGMRTNTVDISRMTPTEVHQLIQDLVAKDPKRAAAVVANIAKTLKPGQDVSLLQTYLDSNRLHTSVNSSVATYMVNPKNKAITQKFINQMTM
jgi:hypothetical protein